MMMQKGGGARHYNEISTWRIILCSRPCKAYITDSQQHWMCSQSNGLDLYTKLQRSRSAPQEQFAAAAAAVAAGGCCCVVDVAMFLIINYAILPCMLKNFGDRMSLSIQQDMILVKQNQ